ncbi:MAG: hypothetical protein AAFO99_12770 [Bacteroidota bacterium]
MKKADKKNPFKTPEGYFENLTDHLLEKVGNKKEDMPSIKQGFKVPEGYFDDLHNNLVQKLDDQGETKVIKLRSYRKFYFAAASVAAIVLLWFGIQKSSPGDIDFEDLANSDIEMYFENNGFGLSTDEIATIVAIEELEINDILDEQMNQENIMEYLDENLDDVEDLNFEYDDQ